MWIFEDNKQLRMKNERNSKVLGGFLRRLFS